MPIFWNKLNNYFQICFVSGLPLAHRFSPNTKFGMQRRYVWEPAILALRYVTDLRNLMRSSSTFSLACLFYFTRSPMYETFWTESKIK